MPKVDGKRKAKKESKTEELNRLGRECMKLDDEAVLLCNFTLS